MQHSGLLTKVQYLWYSMNLLRTNSYSIYSSVVSNCFQKQYRRAILLACLPRHPISPFLPDLPILPTNSLTTSHPSMPQPPCNTRHGQDQSHVPHHRLSAILFFP